MTAAISAGFLSRAAIGLDPPRSISRRIWPERGGVAFHHGGYDVPILSHAGCLATWRLWQDFHQDGRGWVDLAYTLGVCPHGYVLAGRGVGIRTAANGTNDGNDRFYAICGIVGARQDVSPAMLEAFVWATAELRAAGAGMAVVGHQDLKPTACPHPRLLKLARELDGRPIRTGPAPTDQEEDEMLVRIDAPDHNIDTVYQIVGTNLAPITKPVAELLGGSRWKDRVVTIDAGQASAFRIVDPRDLEVAARLRQGLESVGSTGLGLGRYGPLAVRHLEAEGVDLEDYIG